MVAIVNIALVPVYLRFIGIEAYGLIGVFASLQAVIGLLDGGLSPTLNRELARLSVLPDKRQEMRDLVRTLELVYGLLAVVAGSIAVSLSPFLAHYWLRTNSLSETLAAQSLAIMGIGMMAQLVIGLYSGALIGLHQQVLLNAVNISCVILRHAATVILLLFVNQKVLAFFLCQTVILFVQVAATAYVLWRSLPARESGARFQMQLFKNIWRFAASMTGTSVAALLLTQLDKIILSKMLPLGAFGYYTLASTVVFSIFGLLASIAVPFYPRFSRLVAMSDEATLKFVYHRGCQLMSVAFLPAAVVLALFSYELLFLWTRNEVTTRNTYLLVSVLTFGTALNGLMRLPYYLQLAYGWANLAFYSNIVAAAVLTPLIIVLTSRYGALGGGLAWCLLNIGYVLIVMQVMHTVLFKGELGKWYFQDTVLPLMAASAVALSGRLLLNGTYSSVVTFVSISFISACALVAATLATPQLRSWAWSSLSGLFSTPQPQKQL